MCEAEAKRMRNTSGRSLLIYNRVRLNHHWLGSPTPQKTALQKIYSTYEISVAV
jgi:hypothetical protein